MKDKLVKDIELSLYMKGFEKDDVEKAVQCVISCLDQYDVTERTTELTVRYDDINERILKRYVACLRLDGKSDGTIKIYLWTLNKLSERTCRAYTEMTANDIRFFLSELKEGHKNSYVKSTKAHISAFFKWMKSEDITEKNTCEKVNDIKVEEEVRLPFSSVDIDKLRTSITGRHAIRDRAIIEVLLSSGVRCAELCDINISDVDIANQSIHIIKGKGGKGRVVFISDIATEYLRKYLSKRNAGDALFISQKGERICTDSIRRILKKYAKITGVQNVHPHRFRRTFATEMHRRGMDIDEIRKLMGHTEVQTTLRYIYTDMTQLNAVYKKYVA